MRICIDPGHGGSDPGAIGLVPRRLEEKEFTLGTSLLLREELQNLDHEVIMTRQQDQTRSLAARAAFANRFNADLFVSIHANAAANPVPEGIEVFHFAGSDAGSELASRVQDSLIAEFPDHRNRGVKEANFAVLRLTNMPAILVECEFLTNPDQLRFLSDPANRRRIAAAIARAIEE
jgi:N-acetylmuramoyl-L-alanine amidase